MGHKASVMREKCCGMVLHGGRPDPVEVVDALTELEAERDAACAAGFEAGRDKALKVVRQRMKEWDLADMSNYFNAAAAIERSVSNLQPQKKYSNDG